MYTPISYALSRLEPRQGPQPKKLKILTQPTHEGFQTMLGGLDHEFYMITGQGIKPWDFHTKPLPPNHYLLTQPFPPLPAGLEFDLLFAQEMGSLQRFIDLGRHTGVPVLSLTHTMPPFGIPPKQLAKMQAIRGNRHIFITEFSKTAWGGRPEDKVIYHGVNLEQFKGWNGLAAKHGISVVNQFASRDVFCGWTEWQEVAKQIPMKLVGENPGLSQSAKSTEDLVAQLASARFFLNTSKWSPIPLSLIEAAAVGCPIITTNHQEIGKFFKGGENCLVANTAEEMVAAAQRILADDDLAIALSLGARATAERYFDYQRFLVEWDQAFLRTWRFQ